MKENRLETGLWSTLHADRYLLYAFYIPPNCGKCLIDDVIALVG